MPPSDANDLLRALWQAVERAGELEGELRRMADELAGQREVTRAALRALDVEIRSRKDADARTLAGGRSHC
jgi:hypothetical protein